MPPPSPPNKIDKISDKKEISAVNAPLKFPTPFSHEIRPLTVNICTRLVRRKRSAPEMETNDASPSRRREPKTWPVRFAPK